MAVRLIFTDLGYIDVPMVIRKVRSDVVVGKLVGFGLLSGMTELDNLLRCVMHRRARQPLDDPFALIAWPDPRKTLT